MCGFRHACAYANCIWRLGCRYSKRAKEPNKTFQSSLIPPHIGIITDSLRSVGWAYDADAKCADDEEDHEAQGDRVECLFHNNLNKLVACMCRCSKGY